MDGANDEAARAAAREALTKTFGSVPGAFTSFIRQIIGGKGTASTAERLRLTATLFEGLGDDSPDYFHCLRPWASTLSCEAGKLLLRVDAMSAADVSAHPLADAAAPSAAARKRDLLFSLLAEVDGGYMPGQLLDAAQREERGEAVAWPPAGVKRAPEESGAAPAPAEPAPSPPVAAPAVATTAAPAEKVREVIDLVDPSEEDAPEQATRPAEAVTVGSTTPTAEEGGAASPVDSTPAESRDVSPAPDVPRRAPLGASAPIVRDPPTGSANPAPSAEKGPPEMPSEGSSPGGSCAKPAAKRHASPATSARAPPAKKRGGRVAGATLADLLAAGAVCAGDRNLTVHFAKKPLEPRASLCADGSITLEGATVASLSKLYIDVVRMNGIDSVTKGNGWANVYYEGEPLMARRDGAARPPKPAHADADGTATVSAEPARAPSVEVE